MVIESLIENYATGSGFDIYILICRIGGKDHELHRLIVQAGVPGEISLLPD